MGYEVHIVRQNDYDNEEEISNITLTEWLDYVSSDQELKLTNGYESKIPGIEVTWQNRPGFCDWHGHPQKDSGTIPWFDYGSGCISAKYPDNLTINKMINISLSLNAKVRGDDFEYYDENYLLNQEKSDTIANDSLDKQHKSIKKPWWKIW